MRSLRRDTFLLLGALAALREAQFLTLNILMESLVHGMFMEMNWLNIMLVIEAVVELVMHGVS